MRRDEQTDSRLIVANNLLEFHFTGSLNHRFSYHTTPNALLQITKQLSLQVSTGSFLGTRTTVLNIGQVTRNAFFSQFAKAIQQFLCQKPRLALPVVFNLNVAFRLKSQVGGIKVVTVYK